MFGLLIPAAKWYVDAGSGSDSNTGLSPDQAFQTLGKLVSVIQAGDMAAINGGSGATAYTYREQLSVPCQCSIVGYGANKPLIDCSDAISAGAWSKTGGQTNVYQASLTIATGASDPYVRAWENGVRFTRATSVANCDATPSSIYVSSDSSSPITLYIHTSDSSNPATNGKTYEYSARNFGYESYTIPGCLVSNLQARRNLGGAGSFRLGQRTTLVDCDALDGNKHNAYIRSYCIVRNCTAVDAYYPPGASLFIYNDALTGGEPVTFINCSASMPSYDATVGGFGGHGNGVAPFFGTILFQGCSATNCGIGFDAADCALQHLAGCTITNCGQWLSVSVNTTIDSNSTLINTLSMTSFGIAIINPNLTLTLRNTTLTHPNLSGTNAISAFSGGIVGVTIDVQNCSYTQGETFIASTKPIAVISRDNSLANGWWYYNLSDPGVTVDSDYNSFVSPGTGLRVTYRGTAYTYAQWKALGFDSHSTP